MFADAPIAIGGGEGAIDFARSAEPPRRQAFERQVLISKRRKQKYLLCYKIA